MKENAIITGEICTNTNHSNINNDNKVGNDKNNDSTIPPPICSSCNKPIFDRYLHNVLDKFWHIQCLRCADCCCVLTERCFEKDNKLYCFKDYRKRMYTKCALCMNIILPTDLVQHSRGNSVYHLKCFMCVMCQKPLATGEEYCLIDGFKPICKHDYLQQCVFNDSVPGGTLTCMDTGIKQPHDHQHNTVSLDGVESMKILDENRNHTDIIMANKSLNLMGPDIPNKMMPHNNNNNNNYLPHFPEHLHINPNLTGDQNDLKSHLFCPTTQNLIIQPPLPSHTLHSLSMENHSSDSQLMTPDQNEHKKCLQSNPNNIQMTQSLAPNTTGPNSEKDGEICSLDDDLKSSFSPASSPDCCPLKDDSQEGQDGNLSDDSYQDDQQSMCLPESRDSVQSGGNGTKRRGPRTTIKAKQLDTLKAAFAATPKPTRHVREQLAQDTGLTMRVIQVWFQNRRSKERRMKQLSAMGARRSFFRNPRRMRSLSRGFGPEDHLNPAEAAQLMNNPSYHGYFGENPEFCNALAALGGNFPPGSQNPGSYPPTMGPPGLHRDFFLATSVANGLSGPPHIQGPPSFISLSQPNGPHPPHQMLQTPITSEGPPILLQPSPQQSTPQQPIGMSV